MMAVLAGTCTGCLYIEDRAMGVTGIVMVGDAGPVESGWGGGVSVALGEVPFVGGGADLVAMELQDGTDLLQSRVYLQLNIPFAINPFGVLSMGRIVPVVGMAFSDVDHGSGWDVDDGLLYGCGLELVLSPAYEGSRGPRAHHFFLIGVRHLRVNWGLEGDGHTTERMKATEVTASVVWKF